MQEIKGELQQLENSLNLSIVFLEEAFKLMLPKADDSKIYLQNRIL